MSAQEEGEDEYMEEQEEDIDEALDIEAEAVEEETRPLAPAESDSSSSGDEDSEEEARPIAKRPAARARPAAATQPAALSSEDGGDDSDAAPAPVATAAPAPAGRSSLGEQQRLKTAVSLSEAPRPMQPGVPASMASELLACFADDPPTPVDSVGYDSDLNPLQGPEDAERPLLPPAPARFQTWYAVSPTRHLLHRFSVLCMPRVTSGPLPRRLLRFVSLGGLDPPWQAPLGA